MTTIARRAAVSTTGTSCRRHAFGGGLVSLSMFAACVVWAAGCGADRGSDAESRSANVLLISLDTTRADRTGALGRADARTPELDRLAKTGICYTQCRTVAPTTLASHASIFTATHPHTHGTPRNGFVVHEDNTTIAELVAERGYQTAGVIGSFALDGRFAIDQGFDVWDQSFDRLDGIDAFDQDQRSATRVTDAALGAFDAFDPKRPWLLFVHYFDPHLPYLATEIDRARFGETSELTAEDIVRVRAESTAALGVPTELTRRFEAAYEAEMAYTDRELGRLLAALRARGALASTIVVVVGDHGENFYEHDDTFDHGHTLYETVLHVPLVVRLGANVDAGVATAGVRIDDPVTTIDVVPTILDRLGIDVPSRVEGRLLPPFDGVVSPGAPRSIFAEATKPWEDVEVESRWTNHYKARSIVDEGWKLVHTPYANREELYDLERDPGERRDLLRNARGEPTRGDVAAIRDRLRTKLDAFAAEADPLPSRFDPSQRQETIERLKRMGYLEDGAPPARRGGG